MPEDPNLIEGNAPPGEVLDDTPQENTQPRKTSSIKRRRINLDWKSQQPSEGVYTSSRRVVLGPGAEIPATPNAPITASPEAQIPENIVLPPLPIEAGAESEASQALPEGESEAGAYGLDSEVTVEPDSHAVAVEEAVDSTPPLVEAESPTLSPEEGFEVSPFVPAALGSVAEAIEPQTTNAELKSEQLSEEISSPSESIQMLEPTQPAMVRVCPFLGLRGDRSTHFIEPSTSQICYSPTAPGEIELDHQRDFCFSYNFPACSRFAKSSEAVEHTVPVPVILPAVQPPALSASSTPIRSIDVEPRRRSRVFDFVLWGVAIGLAIIAIVAALPFILGNSGAPTPAPIALRPSSTVTLTLTPEITQVTVPTAPSTLAPLVIPTPSANQVVLDLLPDPRFTGWASSNESEPHWGDTGLNAGSIKNQTYVAIAQFNLKNYPPGSKVQFAALELTGSDASHLGKSGEWHIEILKARTAQEWLQASTTDIATATSLATLNETLTPTDLAIGNINRFTLDDAQRQLLDDQFKDGSVTFRLTGPSTTEDDLFSWDSGAKSSLNAPALHLVVEPGQYTIVTNTPTPANVLTAAAYVVKQTAFATRQGTPTPFPPGVATATPGGETIFVPADTAVAENVGTAVARSVLATAVALTTGTYTPSPGGLVVIYPTATPFLIRANDLSTPTPILPTNFGKIFDSPPYKALVGSIIALSNFYSGTEKGEPIVLNTGGGVLGKLSSDLYYKAALQQDLYSPDERSIAYPIDSRGRQQIGFYDKATGLTTTLTSFQKGKAYDGAWSPDGGSIVFVAQDPRCDDIYYYDIGNQKLFRVTQLGPQGCPFVKHPSFSPDGQNIVFWSSIGGALHIFVVDRSGQIMTDLSSTRADVTETDPVWVK